MADVHVNWKKFDPVVADQLVEWWYRARINQKILYREQQRYTMIHRAFGIPAILLSVAVGSLALILNKYLGEEWIRIGMAIGGFVAAFLTALQTFFRFNEHADICKKSAIKYGDIVRKLEYVLAKPPADDALEKQCEIFLKELTEAANSAPTIPHKRWEKFKKNPGSWGMPKKPQRDNQALDKPNH
ncbi:MAG TPA: SLATT domain-containing protein [Pyrinomonadaceae bacterium]|jgi:hypothetical protein